MSKVNIEEIFQTLADENVKTMMINIVPLIMAIAIMLSPIPIIKFLLIISITIVYLKNKQLVVGLYERVVTQNKLETNDK